MGLPPARNRPVTEQPERAVVALARHEISLDASAGCVDDPALENRMVQAASAGRSQHAGGEVVTRRTLLRQQAQLLGREQEGLAVLRIGLRDERRVRGMELCGAMLEQEA